MEEMTDLIFIWAGKEIQLIENASTQHSGPWLIVPSQLSCI